MSWAMAIALGMAALLALANAARACLLRLSPLEERLLDGRGLSPSILLALHQAGEGRA